MLEHCCDLSVSERRPIETLVCAPMYGLAEANEIAEFFDSHVAVYHLHKNPENSMLFLEF